MQNCSRPIGGRWCSGGRPGSPWKKAAGRCSTPGSPAGSPPTLWAARRFAASARRGGCGGGQKLPTGQCSRGGGGGRNKKEPQKNTAGGRSVKNAQCGAR